MLVSLNKFCLLFLSPGDELLSLLSPAVSIINSVLDWIALVSSGDITNSFRSVVFIPGGDGEGSVLIESFFGKDKVSIFFWSLNLEFVG
jgi:hypothetical protein